MDKYICIRELELPWEDEDGSITENYGLIKINSEWEVSRINGESEVRLNLINGESDFSWIDITKEHLKEFFNSTYQSLEQEEL